MTLYPLSQTDQGSPSPLQGWLLCPASPSAPMTARAVPSPGVTRPPSETLSRTSLPPELPASQPFAHVPCPSRLPPSTPSRRHRAPLSSHGPGWQRLPLPGRAAGEKARSPAAQQEAPVTRRLGRGLSQGLFCFLRLLSLFDPDDPCLSQTPPSSFLASCPAPFLSSLFLLSEGGPSSCLGLMGSWWVPSSATLSGVALAHSALFSVFKLPPVCGLHATVCNWLTSPWSF